MASFPLVITALTLHVRSGSDAARIATQLVSHVISAIGAAMVSLLHACGSTCWAGLGHAVLPIGCVILVWLQFTRLRHPPAMASGGAVLCGIDPIAVIGCAAVTGALLLAELLVLRFRRPRHN